MGSPFGRFFPVAAVRPRVEFLAPVHTETGAGTWGSHAPDLNLHLLVSKDVALTDGGSVVAILVAGRSEGL